MAVLCADFYVCARGRLNSGGKVNVEYVVDPALLGGLIVERDGKIMDASLRRRLREVKEVISK